MGNGRGTRFRARFLLRDARGLTSLEREYQNAVREFESLKAKQQSALLAENLEIAQKAEKFTLLEPPVRPEKPEKPDRIKILVLGVALSHQYAQIELRERVKELTCLSGIARGPQCAGATAASALKPVDGPI